MTIPSGFTTSSPDTATTSKQPLEEAPFSVYLEILRENGYEAAANDSELFYIELLTTPFEDGSCYTKEQIYDTPFKNLVLAAEKLIDKAYVQVNKAVAPVSANGPVLSGEGADKLTPEQLRYLLARQLESTEVEKQRMGSMR